MPAQQDTTVAPGFRWTREGDQLRVSWRAYEMPDDIPATARALLRRADLLGQDIDDFADGHYTLEGSALDAHVTIGMVFHRTY